MGKYLVRYLIFWIPAFLVSSIFGGRGGGNTMQILMWFTAFFMVFGWLVNTGMAAYNYPWSTLAVLCTYSGFTIILVVIMYSSLAGSGIYTVCKFLGGVLSFKPLDIFVKTLMPFMIPHELVVAVVLIICCAIGYILGLVQRHVRPNPYHPRIKKSE